MFIKYTAPGSIKVQHIYYYRNEIIEGMTVKLPTGEGVILRKYKHHAMTTLGDFQWVDIYAADVLSKKFGDWSSYGGKQ